MAVFWIERTSYADHPTAREHRYYIQTDVCDPRAREAVARAYAARVTAARSAGTDEAFGPGSGGAVWCYLGREVTFDGLAEANEVAHEQARRWLTEHADLVDGDTLRISAASHTFNARAPRGRGLLRFLGSRRERG